jgi:hypothetical protein
MTETLLEDISDEIVENKLKNIFKEKSYIFYFFSVSLFIIVFTWGFINFCSNPKVADVDKIVIFIMGFGILTFWTYQLYIT